MAMTMGMGMGHIVMQPQLRTGCPGIWWRHQGVGLVCIADEAGAQGVNGARRTQGSPRRRPDNIVPEVLDHQVAGAAVALAIARIAITGEDERIQIRFGGDLKAWVISI